MTKESNCVLEEPLSGSCLMEMSQFLCPHCDLRQTQIKYCESQGYSKPDPGDVVQVYVVHQTQSKVDFFPGHSFPLISHWIGSVVGFF